MLSFPNKLGNLTSLTTLNISSCSSLILLPKKLGNFTLITT
uniref:Uncharacterized protein n=1 Tax=Physcomitrium patens TaxID=3218 RepID=A0A7I4END2_PHYPA